MRPKFILGISTLTALLMTLGAWVYYTKAYVSTTSISNLGVVESKPIAGKEKPNLKSTNTIPNVAGSGKYVAQGSIKSLIRPLADWQTPRRPPEGVIGRLPEYVANARNGDIKSDISLFEAASWCVSRRAELTRANRFAIQGLELPAPYSLELSKARELCKAIDEDTINQRFSTLEKAANSGNVEAMIMYERAVFLLPAEDPAWVWRHTEILLAMRNQAIGFLERAALMGVREAHLQLADIYRTGRYGFIDVNLANSYLLSAQGEVERDPPLSGN